VNHSAPFGPDAMPVMENDARAPVTPKRTIDPSGLHDRIERLSPNGSIVRFGVTGARASFSMTGIAAGPDGALWFTQRGYGRHAPDGIGRMTVDGRYSSWPLPHRRAAPQRIAAGPDGALWFTEPGAASIGRITPSGAITEFALRPPISPAGIVAGADGALWFSAESCIGRITTSGAVTTWPVHHVGALDGIAPAPGGGFWLADAIRSAVRRFTPPVGAGRAGTGCHRPTTTRRLGATRASLVYTRNVVPDDVESFAGARMTIARTGRQVFSEVVPPNPQDRFGHVVEGSTASFRIRDLDGDGEPEVRLLLDWGGAHCCSWSRIYRYVRARRTYLAVDHFWGNGSAEPVLRDIDGDGRPEFISEDDGFAYDFEGYAGSVRPIRIWSYAHGAFRDVTRRFPRTIARDATHLWRLYVKYRGRGSEGRGVLPAWAADEYMLGRGAAARRTLEDERLRGHLDCPASGGCFDSPTDPAAYLKAVYRLLGSLGYLRG